MKKYETSIIADLSPDAAEAVMLMRSRSIAETWLTQSKPHLTILFVGFLRADLLRSVCEDITNPPYTSIEVGLQELNCFAVDGVVTNIHIRVELSSKLIELHQWALDLCRRHNWEPPNEISGLNYVPHITIIGGISKPTSVSHFGGVHYPERTLVHNVRHAAHVWAPALARPLR